MKTTTINLYGFKELNKEAQEKVIKDLWDLNLDFDDNVNLGDYIMELKELGYTDPIVNYTGFSSQGDGLRFTSHDIDLEKFIKRQKNKDKFAPLIPYIQAADLTGSIYATTSQYFHEHTAKVSLELNDYETAGTIVNDLLTELENAIEAERMSLCRKYYKRLEQNYYYDISAEAIIETIEANGYTFEANGTMRNA